MDTLHTVLRSIRGGSRARNHLDIFREFFSHLDRSGRRPPSVRQYSSARRHRAGVAAGEGAALPARLSSAVPSFAQGSPDTGGLPLRPAPSYIRDMLQRHDSAELDVVRGAIYFSPYASPERLETMRRFVREHARGRWRWSRLRQYPAIEFDTIDDLTAVRTKFARFVEAYVDFTR